MLTFSATFRIMGEALSPPDVSRLLGLAADEAHVKGEPRVGSAGRRYADYAEGFWCLESDLPQTASVDDHVRALASKLLGHEGALKGLRAQGYRMDIFVGIFGIDGNASVRLSPSTMGLLGRLQLDLDLDLYG